MTAPKGRPHKRCIFCGGPNVSKEHFFSAWMAPLLPRSPAYEEFVILRRPDREPEFPRLSKRPADIATKKIRAVCAVCNNGWMERIESAARPFLTPMIEGFSVALDPFAQLKVAKWIALKMIVSEYAFPGSSATPERYRKAFMDSGQIPPQFRIYAGQLASPQLGFYRNGFTVSAPGEPPPALDGVVKNMQQGSLAVGRLFIQMNACWDPQLEVEDRVFIEGFHDKMRLWPLMVPEMAWPIFPILAKSALGLIVGEMDRVMGSDHVRWEGDLPSGEGT